MKSNLAFTLFAVLFIALVWVIAYFAVDRELLVPSPVEAVEAFFVQLGKGSFWDAFFATLWRVVQAFLICFVFGFLFALISYLYPAFSRFFNPLVSFLRSVPTLAVTLLILLWTTPKTAPVVVAVITLFPVLYTSFSSALSSVDKKTVEMCKVYSVPLSKRIKKLYLPEILPRTIKEGAAAFAFALKLTVSAEILSLTYISLGGLMQEASYYFDTPRFFAYIIIVFLLGLFVETIGSLVADKLEERR